MFDKPHTDSPKNESSTLVKMPTSAVMLQKLSSVNNTSHFVQKLYPKFAAMAEQKLEPSGLVLGLLLAIRDYSKGMPAMLEGMTVELIPIFIEALVEDKQKAQQAKDYFKSL